MIKMTARIQQEEIWLIGSYNINVPTFLRQENRWRKREKYIFLNESNSKIITNYVSYLALID